MYVVVEWQEKEKRLTPMPVTTVIDKDLLHDPERFGPISYEGRIFQGRVLECTATLKDADKLIEQIIKKRRSLEEEPKLGTKKRARVDSERHNEPPSENRNEGPDSDAATDKRKTEESVEVLKEVIELKVFVKSLFGEMTKQLKDIKEEVREVRGAIKSLANRVALMEAGVGSIKTTIEASNVAVNSIFSTIGMDPACSPKRSRTQSSPARFRTLLDLVSWVRLHVVYSWLSIAVTIP